MLTKTPSTFTRWNVIVGLAWLWLLVVPPALAVENGEPIGIVKLRWDLSWEPDIAGYRVHWGAESGQYTEILDVGYEVKAQLENLPVGATYFAAVTAYNTYGLESDYSNEISFTVVTPPSALDTDGDLLSDLFEETYGKGGDVDPSADLDGDGLSTLAEFAHGLNPLRAQEQPAVSLESVLIDETPYLSIRYVVDPVAERFVSIVVERSTDLSDPAGWQRGQTTITSAKVSEDDPDLIEIVARSLTPMTAGRQAFLRLCYEASEP